MEMHSSWTFRINRTLLISLIPFLSISYYFLPEFCEQISKNYLKDSVELYCSVLQQIYSLDSCSHVRLPETFIPYKDEHKSIRPFNFFNEKVTTYSRQLLIKCVTLDSFLLRISVGKFRRLRSISLVKKVQKT
ncbi:hypothetical protein BpHYR1_009251 [Brachionus plicatilis]|uniref:Uncharacterized protein n=1 Tax=Brachionus plicatilis TaxID=10195 RepID=A0A3M7QZY9_BRAPC|nr:hypothetical protein BpHYR1_009251 [Brachionus plicatilis]